LLHYIVFKGDVTPLTALDGVFSKFKEIYIYKFQYNIIAKKRDLSVGCTLTGTT